MEKENETYEKWKKKIDYLANYLLNEDYFLKKLSMRLKESEKEPEYRGVDVLYLLIGVLQQYYNDEFIPGPYKMNLIAILGEVQRKSNLDLGVCEFLVHNIENYKKLIYNKNFEGDTNPLCMAGNSILTDLSICLPPKRRNCIYRIETLMEKVKELN